MTLRAGLLTILMMMSVYPVVAQSATATPAAPTGTLIPFSTFVAPTFPALPTAIWATPLPPVFGHPFEPKTPPTILNDSSQQLGFGSIGETGAMQWTIYLAETFVAFYQWLFVNAPVLIRGVRVVIIVVLLSWTVTTAIKTRRQPPKAKS